MSSLSLYNEIQDNLESSYKGLKATELIQENRSLRSVDEAELVLKVLEKIASNIDQLLKDFPSLKSLFEKDYGDPRVLSDRESILEICFLEDYLLPDKSQMPLTFDELVTSELLDNYLSSMLEWVNETREKHLKSQSTLQNDFTVDLKSKDLPCACQKCLADYRGKLRDTVYKNQKKLIDEKVEQLHEMILSKSLDSVADFVSKLRGKLDKELKSVRYRLKRGSLNKLDQDIKSYLKFSLGAKSEVGITYRERVKSKFISVLVDKELDQNIITDDEYERFFYQLGLGLWKSENWLIKEFSKLLNSVLAFKRKDISANILKEYLGKFWIYAQARQKKRKVIYHMGPTNSGKTYNAIEALSKSSHGCYLAPLRLLASELYDTLNEKGVKTSLLTGEEVIDVPDATHYSSTIEMAKMSDDFDCVVIDEIQMITDSQRGWAWTRALVNINADEVHLCGDDSVYELVEKILSLTGDELEVKRYERKTSLTVINNPIKLIDLDKGDALIVFSRRNALKYKMDLERLGFKVSIVYGRLSPEVRREQARKFDSGETDIIVSTDAIAMGMNLPIKRVIFSTLSKFFNSKEHPITESEIKQIAGRAGRFGRYPEGFTTTLKQVDNGPDIVNRALNIKLKQKELAMVGPDLEIFRSVNKALSDNNLKTLNLSEFLRLFNTMIFEKPFYCVDLNEMINVTEMVEDIDENNYLSDSEIFGFACAPVNLGLIEHVQYFVWIANHYVKEMSILNEEVDPSSDDIDYLERSIKCVELYQWLARHFQNKNFSFDEKELLQNKAEAIERLNQLLSEKTSKKCSSCGCKLPDEFEFNICETCFSSRRFGRRQKNFKKNRFTTEKSSQATRSNTPSKSKKTRFSRSGNENKNSSGKSRDSRSFKKSKNTKKSKNKASAFKRG